ncbi:hypothetical protein [Shimazuella alba]|jgi:hypothetical protein|uniref:Uncharacterized protein n=1 Tax=Shimazuella alba TaxID=2690964 RepID=A0A6I4VW50_9BACL|nr:hypothetical protein [Shimazuella alba]MXQ54838.1 hypothetical protein [Shimazuella alba]
MERHIERVSRTKRITFHQDGSVDLEYIETIETTIESDQPSEETKAPQNGIVRNILAGMIPNVIWDAIKIALNYMWNFFRSFM